jgi:hypothetical protein
VDVTGLQSLPEVYERAVPLCTQSQWGWHSFPAPGGPGPSELRMEMFDSHGRQVGYATSSKGQEPLFNWLRENPHRLNLARIGFLLDGKALSSDSVEGIDQRLSLWDGTIESRFELEGKPVKVRTCCHESRDCIAVEVESPLAAAGRLAVAFDFPYGSPGISASDWNNRDRHTTEVTARGRSYLALRRQLDADLYHVRIDANDSASANLQGHRVLLEGPTSAFVASSARRPLQDPLHCRRRNAGASSGPAADAST